MVGRSAGAVGGRNEEGEHFVGGRVDEEQRGMGLVGELADGAHDTEVHDTSGWGNGGVAAIITSVINFKHERRRATLVVSKLLKSKAHDFRD